MSTVIRAAQAPDLPAITAIFNHYVATSTCIYQDEPDTIESRRDWLTRHDARHPVLVADAGGQIVGWAALSPFGGRSGYAATVENTVYVRHDRLRQGLGKLLLASLIEAAWEAGHHTIIARIDSEQTVSLALHRRLGFVEAGRLREAGRKFDHWRDVIFLQLLRPAP